MGSENTVVKILVTMVKIIVTTFIRRPPERVAGGLAALWCHVSPPLMPQRRRIMLVEWMVSVVDKGVD